MQPATKKRLILIAKIVLMVVVIGFIAKKFGESWNEVSNQQLHIDWRFAFMTIACFAGSMLTNTLVWRWLAYRMGDRNRTLPLLGAYLFSQMGKYAPGKIMLLLMRIERAERVGMNKKTVVVSTLIENAMYMVSGGVTALLTLALFLINRPVFLVAVLVPLAILVVMFHPSVFYKLVNKMLVKWNQPPVQKEEQLRKRDLALSVLMFTPVWIFGGIGLWSAARTVTMIPIESITNLPGAFALSVTGGMASFLPGGLGIAEAIKSLFLDPITGPKAAVLAVAIQRMAQIIVEVILGTAGGLMTSVGKKSETQTQPPVAPCTTTR